MTKRITVLIADDHPVVRKGLKESIEEDPALIVVAEASNGEEALKFISDLKPHVAILDIHMPRMNGLRVAQAVQARSLATGIIFMTFHSNEDVMRGAMEAGAKGYLLKESELDEVAGAIHAVAKGRTYIGSTTASRMIGLNDSSSLGPAGKYLKELTFTEKKILRLLADGKSSKEIGDELSIHYRTVDNHRTNVCRKLGLEGANALTRFVLQHQAALQERLN
jgi:DNA-binding NarL/FixJ family response regulator